MTILTRKAQEEAVARVAKCYPEPWDVPREVADNHADFIAHVRIDAPLAYATLDRLWPLVEYLAKQPCISSTYGSITRNLSLTVNCGQCPPCQARQAMKEWKA